MPITNAIVNSVNIVTGCSSGLGRATFKWLLDKGAKAVLGVDRQFDPDFYDYIGYLPDNKRILTKQHDTFDQIEADKAIQELHYKHGPINNLVNAAGVCFPCPIYIPSKNTAYFERDFKQLLKFNVLGTFIYTTLVTKNMVDNLQKYPENTHRCIINVGSISSHYPSGGQVAYASNTSAIAASTLGAARELAPYNIRVNTIEPGYFSTKLLYATAPEIIEFIENFICLCPTRLGDPDEFAHLVQSIIENQMINGTCIRLDAAATEVNILKLSTTGNEQ